MKKVIIAGANSFVASHYVHELLTQNYHVIGLVRGSDTMSAEERMDMALQDTTLDVPSNSGKLTVLDYALLEENYGLDVEKLKSVFEGKADYFHFAASLKFDYRSKEEIFETNIDGVQNALKIFTDYANDNSKFFFVSTAYSCGKFSGVFEEKFYPDEGIAAFRNYYEQSKRLAENVVQQHIRNQNIEAHIIRLSQVVGDSRSGVTRTDYGVFDFAKRVNSLSQQHPGEKIRIRVDPQANQNLIPIDTVVYDLVNLVKSEKVPVIMNFVAKNPIENRKIIRSISDLLPIELVPQKELTKDEMNDLEKRVLAGMSFTGNYIDTDIPFDTTQRDKVISEKHREVNESNLFAMLAYYLDRVSEEKAVESGA